MANINISFSLVVLLGVSNSIFAGAHEKDANLSTKAVDIEHFVEVNVSKNNLEKTPAYLIYRYGEPKNLELEYPGKKEAAIKTKLIRYTGANTRFTAHFKINEFDYLFESAYIDDDRIHGMSVYKDKKRQAFIACHDHKSANLPPTALGELKKL